MRLDNLTVHSTGARNLRSAAELVAQEAVVEARVMGHEQAAFEPGHHIGSKLREGRRVCDHVVGDPGELLDLSRHAAPGVHERVPLLHDPAALDQHDAHLDDTVVDRAATGRFQVDAGERAVEQ
jgi:hypothetical protein